MTAAFLFNIANPVVLVGWLVLIASIVLKRPFLRDEIAGRWFPIGFEGVKLVFGKSEKA
jgi:hypothetical protein